MDTPASMRIGMQGESSFSHPYAILTQDRSHFPLKYKRRLYCRRLRNSPPVMFTSFWRLIFKITIQFYSHYIYTCAFGRWFCPKWFFSVSVFLGNGTHNLCSTNAMLYQLKDHTSFYDKAVYNLLLCFTEEKRYRVTNYEKIVKCG